MLDSTAYEQYLVILLQHSLPFPPSLFLTLEHHMLHSPQPNIALQP